MKKFFLVSAAVVLAFGCARGNNPDNGSAPIRQTQSEELTDGMYLSSPASKKQSPDVTAYIARGNLYITGNNQGVTLTISQPRSGKITITGEETTINGKIGPQTFSGVVCDMVISLGKGDDNITFDLSKPMSLAGGLTIKDAGGSNKIVSFPEDYEPKFLRLGQDLTVVSLSAATNQIDFSRLEVNGNVSVTIPTGSSSVGLGRRYGDESAKNKISGSIAVSYGKGDFHETLTESTIIDGFLQIYDLGTRSVVAIDSSSVGKNASFVFSAKSSSETRLVNSIFQRNLQIVGGRKDSNSMFLSGKVIGNTSIIAGSSDDTIVLSGMTFEGAFDMRSGGSKDSFFAGTSTEYSLTRSVTEYIVQEVNGKIIVMTVIRPGRENTYIDAEPVKFNGTVYVSFGKGDDFLSLAQDAKVTFKKTAIFDGQCGANVSEINLIKVSGKPTIKRFRTAE